MLRKDHRWEMAELLERDEKEKYFEEHKENLYKKSKEMFHKLLDETQEVSLIDKCSKIRVQGFQKRLVLNFKW